METFPVTITKPQAHYRVPTYSTLRHLYLIISLVTDACGKCCSAHSFVFICIKGIK